MLRTLRGERLPAPGFSRCYCCHASPALTYVACTPRTASPPLRLVDDDSSSSGLLVPNPSPLLRLRSSLHPVLCWRSRAHCPSLLLSLCSPHTSSAHSHPPSPAMQRISVAVSDPRRPARRPPSRPRPHRRGTPAATHALGQALPSRNEPRPQRQSRHCRKVPPRQARASLQVPLRPRGEEGAALDNSARVSARQAKCRRREITRKSNPRRRRSTSSGGDFVVLPHLLSTAHFGCACVGLNVCTARLRGTGSYRQVYALQEAPAGRHPRLSPRDLVSRGGRGE